jgi:hypothetical protein
LGHHKQGKSAGSAKIEGWNRELMPALATRADQN